MSTKCEINSFLFSFFGLDLFGSVILLKTADRNHQIFLSSKKISKQRQFQNRLILTYTLFNVNIFPIQNCEQKSEILKIAIVKLGQDQKELKTGK